MKNELEKNLPHIINKKVSLKSNIIIEKFRVKSKFFSLKLFYVQ